MKSGSLIRFRFLLLLGVFAVCVLAWVLSSHDFTASRLLGENTYKSSLLMAQGSHWNMYVCLHRNVLQNKTAARRPPVRREDTEAVFEPPASNTRVGKPNLIPDDDKGKFRPTGLYRLLDVSSIAEHQMYPSRQPSIDTHKPVRYEPIAGKRYPPNLGHRQAPCIPWQNIIYIKTHKTASSTLQNIIYRFGDEGNLTFALPVKDVYIGSTSKLRASSLLPAAPGVLYNILANHARFLYNDIKRLMPANSKFITIIRKSPAQFRSMYNYFVLESQYNATLEEFSMNPKFFYERYERKSRHNGRDPMLFDLGMDKSSIGDVLKTEQYIKFLDSKLALVLIREYFFESLILLKEELCWDSRALVHVNNKIRMSLDPANSVKPMVDSEMSPSMERRLTRWNAGDVMLYNHFNATLWRKIEAYGKSKIEQEVAELKDLCKQFETECMNGTKPRNISRGSMKQTGVAEYVVKAEKRKNKTCQRLSWKPRTYLANLRRKHITLYHRKS